MSETEKLKERMTAPDWDAWLAIAGNVLGRLADAKDARRAKARAAPPQPAHAPPPERPANGARSWWRSFLPYVRSQVTPQPKPRKRGGRGAGGTVRWGLWGIALAGAGAAGFGLRGAGQPGWDWRRDGLRGAAGVGLAAAGLAVASLAALDRWGGGRR